MGNVLDGPELGTTSSDKLLNSTQVTTGVIPSGQSLSVFALKVISKVALPPSTLTSWVSLTVVVSLSRPDGCCSCEPLLMQPVSTVAVPVSVPSAVVAPPSPETSAVQVTTLVPSVQSIGPCTLGAANAAGRSIGTMTINNAAAIPGASICFLLIALPFGILSQIA